MGRFLGRGLFDVLEDESSFGRPGVELLESLLHQSSVGNSE